MSEPTEHDNLVRAYTTQPDTEQPEVPAVGVPAPSGTPKKSDPKRGQFIAGLVILLATVVGCGILSVNIWNQDASDTAAANAQSTKAAVIQATQTATIKLTPTAPPTLEQLVATAIEHQSRVSDNPLGAAGPNGGLFGKLDGAVLQSGDGQLTISISYLGQSFLTHSLEKDAIQDDMYMVFRAIYYGTGLRPASVYVVIHGDVVDQYGNTSDGNLAVATLSSSTARRFNWDGLLPDEAWNDYDSQWLINGL